MITDKGSEAYIPQPHTYALWIKILFYILILSLLPVLIIEIITVVNIIFLFFAPLAAFNWVASLIHISPIILSFLSGTLTFFFTLPFLIQGIKKGSISFEKTLIIFNLLVIGMICSIIAGGINPFLIGLSFLILLLDSICLVIFLFNKLATYASKPSDPFATIPENKNENTLVSVHDQSSSKNMRATPINNPEKDLSKRDNHSPSDSKNAAP